MARKMSAARSMLAQLDVDERTNGLSDEALVCRSFGHKWERRSHTRRRALELLAQGLVEYQRVCENGCGCTWRQVFSLKDRMIVENERSYPKGGDYLMPSNSGRLARNEAWTANVVRELMPIV